MSKTPENIGRYGIIEMLGKGAMGVVYKAMDPNIDRVVAIKAIHESEFAEASEGEELIARFKREIQTAGLLTNANIVTIYDGGKDNELHWIAMEYVDGPSLRKVIADNISLSFEDILTMIIKICNAMDFAHRRQVIHRDLKPANILLTKEWEPKIADFGIARVESSTMTKTGVILGTPSYMSPEQVTGQRLDSRSDIFSIGIILYELVTRERPFIGDSPTSIMYKIVHSDPVAPTDLNPALPIEITHILGKALAKRPKDRYAAAGEMASDLASLLKSDIDVAMTQPRIDMETTAMDASNVLSTFDSYQGVEAPPVEEKRKSSIFPKFLIALVILIVLAGGTYGLYLYKPEWFEGILTAVKQATPAQDITKTLRFRANEEDAAVYIDGQPAGIANGSDITITRQANTTVAIRIEKDCFEPVTDAVVIDNPDTLLRDEYVLERSKRSIQITGEAEGINVSVNGQNIGTTPATFEIECGINYDITARANGYHNFSGTLNSESIGDDNTYILEMESIVQGTVRFLGDYPVTILNSRGRTIKRNAGTLSLPPGNYDITLTNPEIFLKISRSITIKEGVTSSLELPQTGSLSISVIPASGFTIKINGYEHDDRFDLRNLRVAAQEHEVIVTWGDITKTETVTVAPGENKRLGINNKQ